VLDRLKRNPRTRHIPVHVISVVDARRRGANLGAFAYLEKPVSKEAIDGAFEHMKDFLDRKVRRLLLVEDDAAERRSIAALVEADGNISAAARSLGLHRTQLRRLLTRYDVDPALVRSATRR
jgi:ActR/RegA family two-component response regulator